MPRRGRPGFTQLPSSRTGIHFANAISEQRRLQHPNSLIGSGLALGDADGDGLVDVYLNRLDGPNALYRNLGDWRFEDIANQAGVAAPDRAATGAVFADVDGDGDLDLLVTALGGPNALFLNDGSGVFTEHTVAAELESHHGSTTITLADVDGDRDLDLYVANYKAANAEDLFRPQERSFDRVVRQVGDRWEVVARFREHYRVRILPELDIVVRSERAEPDMFYLNDGTGRFEQISFTSGRFLDEGGNPLTWEPDYFTLTARDSTTLTATGTPISTCAATLRIRITSG
ncbi:MAG: hypothetical protein GTN62_05400 [Gemmatimonadales bacterium]|nr:hypothetical protein [Gemmatimonadales bacterium]NIN10935.1 hypothetical protein [Gemmatimonadales bacterium]NIN49533.1 hypothetical protein [Gemmatimonadales bacterium]NIP06997.1 hypothetical protein [Gemmatimonadales bacterium]NIQ99056.1 hypothetical protein [Gemmatimonadales bacterium]